MAIVVVVAVAVAVVVAVVVAAAFPSSGQLCNWRQNLLESKI